MKRLLFLLLLFVGSSDLAVAQKRPNIDTLSFMGIRPGMPTRTIAAHADSKLDTMLWGGPQGASILGFKSRYMDVPGEYRFAVDALGITQCSFVAATANDRDASAGYEQLTTKLRKKMGPPDDEYANTYRHTTWIGNKQEFAVKTVDGKNYLTVNLSLVTRPTAPAVTPAASSDSQVRRKRKP